MGTNYYAKQNECSHCGRSDDIHIGKSSGGWKFSFQGHPHHSPPITSWKEWQEYLVNCKIVNEYGDEWTLEDLKTLVDSKFDSDHCQTCYCDGKGYHHDHKDYHDPEGHPFYNDDFS